MTETKKRYLSEFFSTASEETINFTVRILVDAMEKICAQCQSDRIRCSLDPMCEERKYLMLLIEAGVPEEEYPQFCYAKKGEEIYRYFFKRTLVVPVRDAVYPIHKLIAYLFQKKGIKKIGEIVRSKNFNEFSKLLVDNLSKVWKSVDTWVYNERLYMVLDGYKSLTIFDFETDLAYINIVNRTIENIEEYLYLTEKLLKINNLHYKLLSAHAGSIYLRILTNHEEEEKVPHLNFEILKKAIKNYTSYVHIKEENGRVGEITLLLYDEYEETDTTFSRLKNILMAILGTK